MKLVIATANAGKAKEFREMLGAERFEWSDLASHHDVPEAEETGRPSAPTRASRRPLRQAPERVGVADDSGLVVDALDGKPGVLSARWAVVNGRARATPTTTRRC